VKCATVSWKQMRDREDRRGTTADSIKTKSPPLKKDWLNALAEHFNKKRQMTRPHIVYYDIYDDNDRQYFSHNKDNRTDHVVCFYESTEREDDPLIVDLRVYDDGEFRLCEELTKIANDEQQDWHAQLTDEYEKTREN